MVIVEVVLVALATPRLALLVMDGPGEVGVGPVLLIAVQQVRQIRYALVLVLEITNLQAVLAAVALAVILYGHQMLVPW